MNALIVTESCFGNTARLAGAVADALRARGVAVTLADAAYAPLPAELDLLIIGSPTHNMGLPGPGSRRQAQDKGGRDVVTGIAEWLPELPDDLDCRVAVFDTVTGTGFFSGSAAKKIEKQLRRRSVRVVARESFLVGGTRGPVTAGEVERAQVWGAGLA